MAVSSNSILTLVIKLLFRDPSGLLNFLFDLFQKFPLFKTLPGMYEVLTHDVVLELKDGKGKSAVYHKHQRVKFLQDNIIAFYDRAWGDGDIFADYMCSPGIAVDRFREGYQYNILISLHETKRRGDETLFKIQRKITNGFTQDEELLQTDISHRTRKLSLSVIFPKSRLPISVSLVEQNSRRTLSLGKINQILLPDGRIQYIWQAKSPQLFESYIMRWKW